MSGSQIWVEGTWSKLTPPKSSGSQTSLWSNLMMMTMFLLVTIMIMMIESEWDGTDQYWTTQRLVVMIWFRRFWGSANVCLGEKYTFPILRQILRNTQSVLYPLSVSIFQNVYLKKFALTTSISCDNFNLNLTVTESDWFLTGRTWVCSTKLLFSASLI